VKLVNAIGGHRRIAAIIVCVLLIVVVLVPLYVIALDVSSEALGFYEMSTTELTERGVLERLQQNRGAH
jgi:predicted PurR-regulated permease PerM